MQDYWNENTSNDIFHFFLVPFFHHFYPKFDSNAHFDNIFSIIGLFNRKKIKCCSIFQYINKNIYYFYAFVIEIDFRNI